VKTTTCLAPLRAASKDSGMDGIDDMKGDKKYEGNTNICRECLS